MRLVISTGLGVDRPEDYAALKQYLMANLPGKPTELVTANPQSCDTLVNQLAAEFNIPVVRRVIEWTENTVAPAKLMVGDMITYASEKPGSAMVVVCHKPSELMVHARTVCQTYELPIHLVRVPPTRYDNGTDQQVAAARDVTAVSTVTRAPQQQNEPYIFPQSFSSLQVFDTCPRQYEAKYITKDVPYVQSPAAKRGDDVHHALEQYLKTQGGAALPSDMAAYTKYADWVLERAARGGGTVLAERMLAVDADLNPVAYKSRSRWVGGKIDVSIVYPGLIEVFDWKTGKVKNNPTQLQMYGGLSLAEHKDVQTVAAGYIWLEAETISPPVFYARDQYANHWDTFQHKYAALRQAYINGVFPPTPNGLCRQWCDVTRCEYHGRGR